MGLNSCLGANKIERLIVKALNSCSGVIIQRLHIGWLYAAYCRY